MISRIVQPVSVLYLSIVAAGLVAGLYADALLVGETQGPAPLPTLPFVAIAQALFFLLVWPVALSARKENTQPIRELLLLFVLAIPFLIVAAFLGNATAGDLFRSQVAVLTLVPISLAAGELLQRPPWRSALLLGLLAIAILLPALCYCVLDFLDAPLAVSLYRAAPVTFIYTAATSNGAWTDNPLWAWTHWILLAGVLGLIGFRGNAKRERVKSIIPTP
jgi:hypothetical protein